MIYMSICSAVDPSICTVVELRLYRGKHVHLYRAERYCDEPMQLYHGVHLYRGPVHLYHEGGRQVHRQYLAEEFQ